MADARDWWLLLACGLAACGPSSDGGATSGAHEAEVDEAIAACKGWATKLDECYGTADSGSSTSYSYAAYYNYLSALGQCIAYIGYTEDMGAGCKAAIEDMYACMSKLECGDLFASDGDIDTASTGASQPDPCAAEEMAADMACSWGDGGVVVTSSSSG
jgi:hypothetical protein